MKKAINSWTKMPPVLDLASTALVYQNMSLTHFLLQWRPCAISSVQVTPHKLP